MECEKCGGKIIDNCCISCGMLLNGNIVDVNRKSVDKYYLQKLFNDDFDSIYRNEKLFWVFILGPLYFSYRGYFIVGTALTFIDFLVYCFNGMIISVFINNPILASILRTFCIIFNRLIYCIFANSICCYIDKLKIRRIKKKYKEKYIEKLTNYKHKKIYLLLTILFYLIPIVLFAIIRRYQNGML